MKRIEEKVIGHSKKTRDITGSCRSITNILSASK